MIKLYSVCWDVTSKCNDTCKFCFRDATKCDLSLEQNQQILNKLIRYGIKKITFTGGEATLYQGLATLIRFAKECNLEVQLITNAKSFNPNNFSHYCQYLDWITLPIDSINPETQAHMSRNPNHLENVINVLDYITSNHLPIRIKINTVVSKVNIDGIEDILSLICMYKIDKWKLFQFSPFRYQAKLNESTFSISNERFENLKRSISQKYTNEPVNIVFQNTTNICSSYFVISSNGDILFGNSDDVVGNILYDDINCITSAMKFDYAKHYSRRKS